MEGKSHLHDHHVKSLGLQNWPLQMRGPWLVIDVQAEVHELINAHTSPQWVEDQPL